MWRCSPRPSPARRLILIWVSYYLLMVVVVFHNEIRYRSAFVPFAFAGAAEGARVLADPAARRHGRTLLGLGAGLLLSLSMVWPYLPRAYRATAAAWTLRPLDSAVARGDRREAGVRGGGSFGGHRRDFHSGTCSKF